MEAVDTLQLEILPKLPVTWSMKYYLKFMFYQPQVQIYFENANYIVKTVNQRAELMSVFRLRYKMFLAHVTSNTNETGFEIDYFDNKCDHIVIVDKKTNKIIGTYRMICSRFFDEFYSACEFKIDRLLELPDTKLELGRACIHPRHRNGATIDMLWRGIWEYARKTGSRYLFGCSSVPTENVDASFQMIGCLKQNDQHSEEFGIQSRGRYSTKRSVNFRFNPEFGVNFKRTLPPLLRSYLNAGAKVHGNPALDRDFECIDMFTLLDLENVNPGVRKRYETKPELPISD